MIPDSLYFKESKKFIEAFNSKNLPILIDESILYENSEKKN